MKGTKENVKIAFLAALMIVSLTACASGESVVTSDNLQPRSNVQIAMEQQAGGGQMYQYVWLAQDPEATIETYRDAYMQEMNKALQETNSSESAAQENRELYEEAMEAELEYYRKSLEQEQLLDPVVSAQESANVAGRILEENYGIDLSQRTLYLSCANSDVNGTQRLQWNVHLYEDADGALFSSSEAVIVLDATTGEIISAEYTPSYDEYQAMLEKLPACYEASDHPDELGVYGFYDVNDPSFGEFQKNISEQIRAALDQSALASGASVASVEVNAADGAVKNETLSVSVRYDNGNTALLTTFKPVATDTQYPLRMLQYVNNSYYGA